MIIISQNDKPKINKIFTPWTFFFIYWRFHSGQRMTYQIVFFFSFTADFFFPNLLVDFFVVSIDIYPRMVRKKNSLEVNMLNLAKTSKHPRNCQVNKKDFFVN